MRFLRACVIGLRALVVLTVLLGVAYPAAVLAAGRVVADRADGSPVVVDGRVVGSRLIGQSLRGDAWLQPRPSAAGDGYDATASGGSNLSPTDPGLLTTVAERRASIARRDGVAPAAVPDDAVHASASGLDPDISPAYAEQQVARIARARGIDPAEVRAAVAAATSGRDLGVLGEPRVNVLAVNAALAGHGRD